MNVRISGLDLHQVNRLAPVGRPSKKLKGPDKPILFHSLASTYDEQRLKDPSRNNTLSLPPISLPKREQETYQSSLISLGRKNSTLSLGYLSELQNYAMSPIMHASQPKPLLPSHSHASLNPYSPSEKFTPSRSQSDLLRRMREKRSLNNHSPYLEAIISTDTFNRNSEQPKSVNLKALLGLKIANADYI